MKICDTKDHGEIVFEGRDCEACETIGGLKEQVNWLEGKVKELEYELEEAQTNA